MSSFHYLDVLPVGVVLINTDGMVTYVNEKARSLIDYPIQGCIWRHALLHIFSPNDDDGHEISLKNGKRVQLSIASLKDEGELLTFVDVTESRHYEAMKADAKRMMLMGKMTASLAHQIRTPLASAMLCIDNLKQPSIDNLKKQRYLDRIQQCHLAIEKHLKNVLLYARGEQLPKQTIPMQLFIDNLLTRSHMLMGDCLLTVSVDEALMNYAALMNEEALISALTNLLNNALEAHASQITFRLSVLKDTLHLVIQDNGDGMSDMVLKQMNIPFFTTKPTGTGLGVSIVKAVIQSHEGQLTIESSEGVGTKIECQLLSLCKL